MAYVPLVSAGARARGTARVLQQYVRGGSQLVCGPHASSQCCGFSSTPGTYTDGSIMAATAQETARMLEPVQRMLDPVVFGTSIWETVHSLSGLPWWAAIPLATVSMRALLLPLSLKAKAATLNFALMQQASNNAGTLLEHLKKQDQQLEQQQQQQGFAAYKPKRLPTRWHLFRQYYSYLKRQHSATSIAWFNLNAFIQVNVFVSMSASLRQMCGAVWPGLSSEGVAWFKDLTQPAVVMGDSWAQVLTWTTPYGVCGLFMPLAIFYTYLQSVEKSPIAQRRVPKAVADSVSIPFFMAGLVVPQATLLYWLTNTGFTYGVQCCLADPRITQHIPRWLQPSPALKKAAELDHQADEEYLNKVIDASEDLGFLKFLTAQYLHQGKHHLVLQCLRRKAVLAPGDPQAHAKVAQASGNRGLYKEAALAHERAAEIFKADGHMADHAQQLMYAGAAWLNAAIKGKPLKGTSEADAVVDKQACIQWALRDLQAALASAPSDSWVLYYMTLAQLAAKDKAAAAKAAQRCWQRCQVEENMETRKVVAAQLTKVVLRLCKQLLAQPQGAEDKWETLETAAEVGVEAVKEAGDVEREREFKMVLREAEEKAAAANLPLVAVQVAQIKGKLRAGRGGSAGRS